MMCTNSIIKTLIKKIQLVRKKRNAVFLGDSTWTELYPNRFIREYPFPSFNIYDLDTVDTSNLPCPIFYDNILIFV